MNKLDTELLENVFDSLDRLFDRETKAIDVYALLLSTQHALSNDDSCPKLDKYVRDLNSVVSSGESSEKQREQALDITNSLRAILNDNLSANLKL
ncbi:MAG: hypothetical protein HWE27_00490 [Gammaproteobacteria bacterium]|nr:hypothetical protein [Gammaproteobacteria bacterium]